MRKNKKKIVVHELVLNNKANVVKNTYEIKKGESIAFVLRMSDDEVIDFPFDSYKIEVEDEDKDFCLVYNNDDITEQDLKQYNDILEKKYKDINCSVNKGYIHSLFKGLKSGKTIRVNFTNLESEEKSHIIIKIKSIFLVPILIFTLALSCAGAMYYIKTKEENDKPEPTGDIVIIDDSTENKDDEEHYIVFPSNMTTIQVKEDEPYYFRNNSYNRVYFHYYIYDYDSKETIDIGQIEPTDEKAIKSNLSKFFEVGVHNIRIDIKTYIDKEETIAKHPMSYNCTLTISKS